MYTTIHTIVNAAMTLVPHHYLITGVEATVEEAAEKLPKHYKLRISLRSNKSVDKVYIP